MSSYERAILRVITGCAMATVVGAFLGGLPSRALDTASRPRSVSRGMTMSSGPVALTREAGKNGKLASLLEEAGIHSVEIPCIAHAAGRDLPKLPATLEAGGFAYVAITSPEAAKVFLEGWEAAKQPPVRVACVGKATGDVLREGGVALAFTPSKATGETLAAELPLPGGDSPSQPPPPPPPRVLYPASAKAQATLQEGLARRGFEVTRLDTYDTQPAVWTEGEEVAAAAAAVAAFGSPSAVKTWARRRGAGSVPAACIGETSARACREAGWPEEAIFFPEKPGMEGWAVAAGAAVQAAAALRLSEGTESGRGAT